MMLRVKMFKSIPKFNKNTLKKRVSIILEKCKIQKANPSYNCEIFNSKSYTTPMHLSVHIDYNGWESLMKEVQPQYILNII